MKQIKDKIKEPKKGKKKSVKKTDISDTVLKAHEPVPYWSEICGTLSNNLWLPSVDKIKELTNLSNKQDQSNTNQPIKIKTIKNSWFKTNEIYSINDYNGLNKRFNGNEIFNDLINDQYHLKPKAKKLNKYQIQNISNQYELEEDQLSNNDQLSMKEDQLDELKCHKIRFKPNAKQRKTLKKWFGASRWCFNYTIDYLKKNQKEKANWMQIYKIVFEKMPEWGKEVPFSIRQKAVKDACIALRDAKKRYMKDKVFSKIKFRSLKDVTQSFALEGRSLSRKGFFNSFLGKITIRQKRRLQEKNRDSRVIYRNNEWFICVPTPFAKIPAENQGRIVALDPGIKSFLTFYSENSCGKLSKDCFSRLMALLFHIDNAIKKSKQANCKQRYRIKKAICNMRQKIKDLVDELHHKSAYFLCNNYDVILIPNFDTSVKVTLDDRNKDKFRTLHTYHTRILLTYAHYRFKEYLKFKAREMGKVVIQVSEDFTSKTCSWSGKVLEKLGRAKFVKDGNITVDRDYNGARGVFLRGLADRPSILEKFSPIS